MDFFDYVLSVDIIILGINVGHMSAFVFFHSGGIKKISDCDIS